MPRPAPVIKATRSSHLCLRLQVRAQQVPQFHRLADHVDVVRLQIILVRRTRRPGSRRSPPRAACRGCGGSSGCRARAGSAGSPASPGAGGHAPHRARADRRPSCVYPSVRKWRVVERKPHALGIPRPPGAPPPAISSRPITCGSSAIVTPAGSLTSSNSRQPSTQVAIASACVWPGCRTPGRSMTDGMPAWTQNSTTRLKSSTLRAAFRRVRVVQRALLESLRRRSSRGSRRACPSRAAASRIRFGS